MGSSCAPRRCGVRSITVFHHEPIVRHLTGTGVALRSAAQQHPCAMWGAAHKRQSYSAYAATGTTLMGDNSDLHARHSRSTTQSSAGRAATREAGATLPEAATRPDAAG